jgi:hypothetical protein
MQSDCYLDRLVYSLTATLIGIDGRSTAVAESPTSNIDTGFNDTSPVDKSGRNHTMTYKDT